MNSKTTAEWRICFIDNQKEHFMGSQDAWMPFNQQTLLVLILCQAFTLPMTGSVIFLLWALVFCL